jgi:hypothetical protein
MDKWDSTKVPTFRLVHRPEITNRHLRKRGVERLLEPTLLCKDQAVGCYYDPAPAPACDRIDPSEPRHMIILSDCPDVNAAYQHDSPAINFADGPNRL